MGLFPPTDGLIQAILTHCILKTQRLLPAIHQQSVNLVVCALHTVTDTHGSRIHQLVGLTYLLNAVYSMKITILAIFPPSFAVFRKADVHQST